MKATILAVIILVIAVPSFARRKSGYSAPRKTKSYSSPRPVRVKGHIKKSGVYVPPSVKTSPNHTKRDNYGTKGNTNPYTGKPGTASPDKDLIRVP